jgi:uncharacterized membrane protein YfcA
MMEFYWYLFLGFLGGIPAGMGMGGGTVTIPLLTIAGGVAQKVAQAANLFAFAPMSLPALRLHAQNGLLKTRGLLWTIVPALCFSLLGALVASFAPSELLRRGFGLFLLGLSVATFRGALTAKKEGEK